MKAISLNTAGSNSMRFVFVPHFPQILNKVCGKCIVMVVDWDVVQRGRPVLNNFRRNWMACDLML